MHADYWKRTPGDQGPKRQPFFENGAVAVDGERICKVGRLWRRFGREFPEGEFVDARGRT